MLYPANFDGQRPKRPHETPVLARTAWKICNNDFHFHGEKLILILKSSDPKPREIKCFLKHGKHPKQIWGHLQTMWTVFWVFWPPPPLWTNMDILETPLPVHVDFSMTPPSALFPKIFSKYQFIGNLKSKHTTSYLWKIVPNIFILHSSLIQYLQILEIKCKNVGIIIHMDRGLDPPPPCGQTWTFWDPPSPLGCPHGL